jgi:hypothetical protein
VPGACADYATSNRIIEITRYQGDYATSLYAYIVTTPVVQHYVYVLNFVYQKDGNRSEYFI